MMPERLTVVRRLFCVDRHFGVYICAGSLPQQIQQQQQAGPLSPFGPDFNAASAEWSRFWDEAGVQPAEVPNLQTRLSYLFGLASVWGFLKVRRDSQRSATTHVQQNMIGSQRVCGSREQPSAAQVSVVVTWNDQVDVVPRTVSGGMIIYIPTMGHA